MIIYREKTSRFTSLVCFIRKKWTNLKLKIDLISRIKNGKYDKCYLKTNEIKAYNNSFIKNDLNLSITISDDQEINEKWSIEAIGVSQYHNLIGISYLPYFKIEVEESHPLLWNYKYDSIECEIDGMDELSSILRNQLLLDLANCYVNQTGGFIRFEYNSILAPIQTTNSKRLFRTNHKLYKIIKPILKKYEISINNVKVKSGIQKGYSNKPNAKVILIRNPIVTSAKLLQDQAFIIADELKFKMNNEA